jgi:acetolactate synthase-1/2/3 large subunit
VTINGGEIIAKGLRAHGVQYVAGVPGAGIRPLMAELLKPGVGIPFIRVVREPSAVHMADGYFRACGRVMAAVLPAHSGIAKAVAALATCVSDSIGAVVITGGESADGSYTVPGLVASRAASPVSENGAAWSKQRLSASECAELPGLLRLAFEAASGGRPGPVHLEVPLNVQRESTEAASESQSFRSTVERLKGDGESIAQAVRMLSNAERPLIVAGGGVVSADATLDLLSLAETLSAPIVTAGNGYGVIPAEHPLDGGVVGQTGSTCANALLERADVVLVIGCRLSDLPDVHKRSGHAAKSPFARMIQIDIEQSEIGMRHAVEVGIVADAKSALVDLKEAMPLKVRRAVQVRRLDFLEQMRDMRRNWIAVLAERDGTRDNLIRSQRPMIELRKVLQRDALVVVGAGGVQAVAKQSFAVHMPRTYLSSGNRAETGWAVPASIGAKLAMPARQVACIVEDIDFLQSMQEIAVCVMHSIPVVYVVYNYSGPAFVQSGADATGSRPVERDFSLPDGKPYSPAYAEIAKSFGLEAWRVEHASQLAGAFRKALDCSGAALVEIMIARDDTGPISDSATQTANAELLRCNEDAI